MRLNYTDLELALEFASVDAYEEHAAYLSIETGKIYYDSADLDEELPPDLDDEHKYLQIPSKRELDLGKPLVLEFVSAHMPKDLDLVYAYFRKSGAYARFKSLLSKRGVLDQWYEYEQSSTRKALLSWCETNSIDVTT